MLKKISQPKGSLFALVAWSLIFLIVLSVVVAVSFILSETSVSSAELHLDATDQALKLQITPTPTAIITPTDTIETNTTKAYTFSLITQDINLLSPIDDARIFFRLPENWLVQEDGILDLDISYNYQQFDNEQAPVLFGDLIVIFDGQTLDEIRIDTPEIELQTWRISLPSSLLANTSQHTLEVVLSAPYLCNIPHQGNLVIQPTSAITVSYLEQPLLPDLSRYPQPFYQGAFEADEVVFVLPENPSEADLANASIVAAKLGDLTSNQMVISATTDLQLIETLAITKTDSISDKHLIIIGQPQDNQAIPLLNSLAQLPLTLYQQQLGLSIQAPSEVSPGDDIIYSYSISNTLFQPVQLSINNTLPFYLEVINCDPVCVIDKEQNQIQWVDKSLAPGETLDISVALKASDVLTGTVVENTVTLIESDLGPVAIETALSTIVSGISNKSAKHFSANENDYFFMPNDNTIARQDGIIQEVVSPWNEGRAILVITGLDDGAVKKASLAMSSELAFPGLSGSFALVSDVLPVPQIFSEDNVNIENTFELLGYSEQTLSGISGKKADYYFYVPHTWKLTDDAFVDVHFNHSELINFEDSELNFLINNGKVASVALNGETSVQGYKRINLAETNIQRGNFNRLTVQPNLSPLSVCKPEQAWLTVRNNSEISLPHNIVNAPNLDLELFPYPFHLDRTLSDLLIVVPEMPSAQEIEQALRIGAKLGDDASADTTLPQIITADNFSEQALTEKNVIIVGRPSRNQIIQQVNAQLPQPFLPESDQIKQYLDSAIIRLPDNSDIGHLQLIASPWNEEHALLVVTGTTDRGVELALGTLLKKPWLIGGNLTMATADKIERIDTRKLTKSGTAKAVSTAIQAITSITATTVVTTNPVITPTVLPLETSPAISSTPELTQILLTQSESEPPQWLFPLMVGAGLAVVIILAIAFWQANRRKSK